MRILVTVSPLMFREAMALSIHDRRPDFEVLIAPPRPSDGRTGRFGPHVLVHDAGETAPPRALAGDLVCRVRVRGAARVDATVEAGGAVSEVRDADLEDLFGALEGAEGLLAGEGGGWVPRHHGPSASLRGEGAGPVFGVIGVGKGKEDTGPGCSNTYRTLRRLSTVLRSLRTRMCRKVQATAPAPVRDTLRGILGPIYPWSILRAKRSRIGSPQAGSRIWCAFL